MVAFFLVDGRSIDLYILKYIREGLYFVRVRIGPTTVQRNPFAE